MGHPLEEFLSATGDDVGAFAHRVGVDLGRLREILDLAQAPTPMLARRLSEATGGAVAFDDFFPGRVVVGIPCRFEGIDLGIASLRRAITALLGEFGIQDPRLSDPRVLEDAAETVAGTYAALEGVTLSEADRRLALALTSVLSEILRDFGVPTPSRERLMKASLSVAAACLRS